MILFLFVIGITLIIIGFKLKKLAYWLEEKANSYNLESMNYSNEDKNLKIRSETGEEFNVSLKVRTSWNDNEDNHYEVSREYTGESEDGSYAYKYTNSNGETGTGWTSESPERFKKRKMTEKIKQDISKVTIKYKGVEYDEKKLMQISENLYETRDNLKSEEVPDIKIDEEISDEKKKELIVWKTKMEANSWKSRQRSLRRKGKLEQYKIDSLNKLGMVWNPKEDEWEKKYLTFRDYGLCDEIEEWVMDQRKLYNNNTISKENVDRLNAVKFPFVAKENEKFFFTTRSIWKLREKLQTKQRRIEREKEKKEGIYKDKRKNYSKVKLTKKEKEERREVNSFYSRKFHYTSWEFVKRLDVEEALNMIENIDIGNSIQRKRLNEFLDEECKKYKEKGKRVPSYIKQFYTNEKSKLSDSQKYDELSFFNIPKVDPSIRFKASMFMLKYISSRNLNNAKSFKEINYLISHYRKEKNKNKLIFLADFVQKYPVLEELYLEKINDYISRIK